MGGQRLDPVIGGQDGQGLLVIGLARTDQALGLGGAVQAGQQGFGAGEAQIGIAPRQRRKRLKFVVFHRLDHIRIDAGDIGGGAEGAVVHVAAGAPGDLGDLGGGQRARAASVELAQAGEGHMVHIHVEPHADGIGGDDVIHLARLIKPDLGVAGAGTERAQYHRRAAPLPPHIFGHGIDFRRRKGDHGGAGRQPVQLFRPGIGQ